MKYAFSTLGCPDWHLDEVLASAKDLGYDGVELRGLRRHIYAPDARPFQPENMERTKKMIRRLGVEIPVLASACKLFNTGTGCYSEGIGYMELAAKLGTPYVRVMGDAVAKPGRGIEDDIVVENLKALSVEAEELNLTLLVETNGVYSDSLRLRRVIEAVESPNVAVLWDVHHPVRYAGETPARTWGNLKRYIRHVHLKDSVVENGEIVYKMLGHGDLPIRYALSILKNADYEGYVTLEWLKRWNGDLEEPGIVFSQFISKVKRIVDSL